MVWVGRDLKDHLIPNPLHISLELFDTISPTLLSSKFLHSFQPHPPTRSVLSVVSADLRRKIFSGLGVH